MKNSSVLAVVAVLAGVPVLEASAYAERRQSGLAADVAVRHRRLLVKKRFEFAPLFESTINADFRHILGGGAKLEYHLGDMLSIGVIGVASTSLDTKLIDKIVPTLLTQQQKQQMMMSTGTSIREPSQDEFLDRLNTMPFHGAAYVSLTPWYGKLAAFGTAYVNFDFYFQAGVSFGQLKSSCPDNLCDDMSPGQSLPNPNDPENPFPPDDNPNNDPPLNNGTKIGLYLAGGLHVFMNDFVALDLSVRDYAFNDNPSGADFNADLKVASDDSRFLHHLFAGVGVSVMLPFQVKRTP